MADTFVQPATPSRCLEAVAAERRRIERDLHDGTQARLVSAAMWLALLDAKLPGDPDAAKSIARETRETLARALAELRDLTRGDDPRILTTRGLGAALEDLCDRAAIPVQLDLSLNRPSPSEVEAAAFFVVSEALTNAAKHSPASQVHVAASCDAGSLVIAVVDDGRGGAAPHGGSGLRGLRDRVEVLGGALAVSSLAGRGTTLRAEMPCALSVADGPRGRDADPVSS